MKDKSIFLMRAVLVEASMCASAVAAPSASLLARKVYSGAPRPEQVPLMIRFTREDLLKDGVSADAGETST